MQYVFFEKGICDVQLRLGQSPRSWGIFGNFCVKSNLRGTEKMGEQDVLLAPPIILLGVQLFPCFPVSHVYHYKV